MQQLFLFIYRYRAFLIFLFLEIVSLWLIVQNNNYQSARFLNSSNRVSGELLAASRGVSDYFGLDDVNQVLSEENAQLKRQLENYKKLASKLNIGIQVNEELLNQYEYISARVIKNSIQKFENYITIDKGSKFGMEPGMAVIDSKGVVGKVKSVSRNFSVITSILHANSMISSKLKKTGDLCTTQWDGVDYRFAEVLYLPRHIKVEIGDTVVTSGYNAIFPEGVTVGVVDEIQIEENDLFYTLKLALINNLNRLGYVYVVKNNMKMEQDSIEMTSY